MTHYSRQSKIVIDVPPAEHDRELSFWSAAAGQQLTQGYRYPGYHGAALHGQDFGLLIQRLGHGPGRVHLDIRTDDLAAEIARLEGLGAERVQRVRSCAIRPGCRFVSSRSPPARSTTATRNAGTNATWKLR